MNENILYRATLDVVAEGRTLVGQAVPWNKPAKVSDGGSVYNEAFAAESFTRSLDLHKRNGDKPFPFFNNHGWRRGEDPIGTVTFERSSDGLLYVAPLSMTRAADDQLTLVRDGAKTAVSIGFRPIREQRVKMNGEVVVLRTEAALRELSLAATGFGLHPDARVNEIRELDARASTPDQEEDPDVQAALESVSRTEEIRRQIRKARLNAPPAF
jgi:HK97 family phage prohead protease